jgi:hypothetical protein
MDMCGSATRCNLAADAGAIGCLLYNVGSITGFVSLLSIPFQVNLVFQAHQKFRAEVLV